MKKRDKGDMTVREMGKLGGLARAAKCTPEELSAIGRRAYALGLGTYTHAELQHLLRGRRRSPPGTIEKNIGEVRKLIKSGWTQGQIAEALGVSRPTLRRSLRESIRRRTAR
jgi:DNA invertase Pin-like site-specific DNA recombinase